MDAKTRDLVRRRAGAACEYCRMPQAATPLITFHVEHTIARQHGAGDDPNWLALACDRCNAYKGTNLSSVEPAGSGNIVPLFNPRTETWTDHFRLVGGVIEGTTDTGRATARLLHMNAPRRVELRQAWREECRSKK